MAAVTVFRDFGAQENTVCHCFHCFPSICHEVMGLDAMIFVFWMLSFKPTFSLYSFTFIKSLFSSSSLCAIRVVSSAYLRLLIFLPACALSSLAFLMMYSAYKLNTQDDNIQPWRTPFHIWNQSVVPCPVLTVANIPTRMALIKTIDSNKYWKVGKLELSYIAGANVKWCSHFGKTVDSFSES